MQGMKLEDVKNIKQTRNADEVNELLDRGYKLIKILSSKQSTGGTDEIAPIYIVALFKEN